MEARIRGVFTMSELLDGSNPAADNRLAADLGVKLSPEQDEIVPLVAIGPAGFEVDASGKPVEMKRPEFYKKFNGSTWADEYAEMSRDEQRAFRHGFLAARGEIVGSNLFDKLTPLYEWLYNSKKGT